MTPVHRQTQYDIIVDVNNVVIYKLPQYIADL